MTAADAAAITNLRTIAFLLSRPPTKGAIHANIKPTALFDPKLTGLFKLMSSRATGSARRLPLTGLKSPSRSRQEGLFVSSVGGEGAKRGGRASTGLLRGPSTGDSTFFAGSRKARFRG
jgi:hypothetical protein